MSSSSRVIHRLEIFLPDGSVRVYQGKDVLNVGINGGSGTTVATVVADHKEAAGGAEVRHYVGLPMSWTDSEARVVVGS